MNPRRGLLAALVLLIGVGAVLFGGGSVRWWGWRPAPGPTVGERYLELLTPPAEARPPAPPDAPHVVLVIACTLRQDQVTPYGGPAGLTPELQALADTGTRFADPIAAAPWTRAAATALLTGRHALSIGMIDATAGRSDQALPEAADTLAEVLRARGWATAGLTLNPNLNAVYGFSQGFDAYLQMAGTWQETAVKVPGGAALSRLDELLAAVPAGRPRYLQAMFIDSHAPISATEQELAEQADPEVPEAVERYRVGVAALDRMVGALREALARHGMTPENTVFMVTNDHGEGLLWPEHHGRGHGRYLAPSAVGGVWIAQGPGIAQGQVVEGVASQVDLLPTLLGVLGLEAPTLPEGLPALPGYDWSPALRGERSPVRPPVVAYTDTWFRDVSRAAAYRSDRACQRDFRGRPGAGFVDGCFVRSQDPQHLRPERDAGLTFLLRRWREEQEGAGRAFAERFGAARQVVPDAALSRQLEALGYVSGEEE